MTYLQKIIKLLVALNLYFRGKSLFVSYFSEIKNVGDILNVDLIEHYSGKTVVNPPGSSRFKHYLVVGSVAHNMNKKTITIGSGLIHDSMIKHIKEVGDIRALRGHLTKACLEKKFKMKFNVPLGDPALLFPKIYDPMIETEYEFALVLHYVDEQHDIKNVIESMGGKVVSVRQEPRKFIDEIKSCKKVLSSSMHGLILADAYEIPNKRLILSDKITGGNFKFKDYYSTTDKPDEEGCVLGDSVSNFEIEHLISKCSVKKYTGDLDELERKFMELSS